jgi:hypothetical protein
MTTHNFNIANADLLARLFIQYTKSKSSVKINIEKADSPTIYGYIEYKEREDLKELTMDSVFVKNLIIRELSIEKIVENFEKILEFLESFKYKKIYIYVINMMQLADCFEYVPIIRFAGLK